MRCRWSIFFTIFILKLIDDAGYAAKSKLANNGWSIELSKAISTDETGNEIEYGQSLNL